MQLPACADAQVQRIAEDFCIKIASVSRDGTGISQEDQSGSLVRM